MLITLPISQALEPAEWWGYCNYKIHNDSYYLNYTEYQNISVEECYEMMESFQRLEEELYGKKTKWYENISYIKVTLILMVISILTYIIYKQYNKS